MNLDAQNTYYGLYANETFNVTDRLSLTAGGRYNLAKIVMADVLGTSPDINGNFTLHELLAARGAGSPVSFTAWLTPLDDRSPST